MPRGGKRKGAGRPRIRLTAEMIERDEWMAESEAYKRMMRIRESEESEKSGDQTPPTNNNKKIRDLIEERIEEGKTLGEINEEIRANRTAIKQFLEEQKEEELLKRLEENGFSRKGE